MHRCVQSNPLLLPLKSLAWKLLRLSFGRWIWNKRKFVLLIAAPIFAHATPHEGEHLLVTPITHPAIGDRLYVCDYAGTERAISLFYPGVPPLPCEVVYHRVQEGEPFEVLWQASFDDGFCEQKLEGLLMQLDEVGWHCEEF